MLFFMPTFNRSTGKVVKCLRAACDFEERPSPEITRKPSDVWRADLPKHPKLP
jgi:hypothetical protein